MKIKGTVHGWPIDVDVDLTTEIRALVYLALHTHASCWGGTSNLTQKDVIKAACTAVAMLKNMRVKFQPNEDLTERVQQLADELTTLEHGRHNLS